MAIYIILAILFFGMLIAVHEWGHFITAKKLGVRVNEFSIGMGPLIYSKQKGETLYSLRALPIGGYCAMEGEDEDTGVEGAFSAQALWKKLIILVAGSFMNLLAGFILVLILLSQVSGFSVPTIAAFMDGFSLESEEGLMVGDSITSIDGDAVYCISDLQLYLAMHTGETMDITIERNGEKIYLEDFPLTMESYVLNGEEVIRYGLYFDYEEATIPVILRESCYTVSYFARSVFMGLQMLITGEVGVDDMAGPVGIVSLIGETGAEAESTLIGVKNVVYIIALVAVNLAVMNLLPLPALDGGRIFLLLIGAAYHGITKKNINPKYEGYVHGIGMVLLLLLMAFVTFQDVLKLVI